MTQKQDKKPDEKDGAPAIVARKGMVDQAVAGLVAALEVGEDMGDEAMRREGEEEIDFVVRVLASIGGVAKVAELKAKLAELTEPRALGKMRGKPKSAEQIANKIGYGTVEIAFCGEQGELWGVPPVRVAGSDFRMKGERLIYAPKELYITGPIDERGVRQLIGYALLVEGKQIAWCKRAGGPLTLGPGQTYNLAGDILFG